MLDKTEMLLPHCKILYHIVGGRTHKKLYYLNWFELISTLEMFTNCVGRALCFVLLYIFKMP